MWYSITNTIWVTWVLLLPKTCHGSLLLPWIFLTNTILQDPHQIYSCIDLFKIITIIYDKLFQSYQIESKIVKILKGLISTSKDWSDLSNCKDSSGLSSPSDNSALLNAKSLPKVTETRLWSPRISANLKTNTFSFLSDRLKQFKLTFEGMIYKNSRGLLNSWFVFNK